MHSNRLSVVGPGPLTPIPATGALQHITAKQPLLWKNNRVHIFTGLFFFLLLLFHPSFVFSAEQVCRVCHTQETLTISRPCPVWEKHAHPVHVVPSTQVSVPDKYPLDKEGKLTCSTCHMIYIEPGSEKRKGGPVGQVYLRGENTNSSMCKRCHAPKLAAQLQTTDGMKKYDKILDESFQPDVTGKFDVGSKSYFNHPVDVISPRMPKHIEANGGKRGVVKDQVICESCHKMHQASGRNLLIIDNSRSELCGFCHAPMFGKSREETSLKGTHPVNIIPSTSMLSKVITFKGGRLGKKRQIICLTCHSIHQATVMKGLLVQDNVRSSLCFKCHRNIQESLTGTKHDLTLSAPEARNAIGQTPGAGGICSSCHMVHNGQGAKMWARPIDKKLKKQDTIAQLCTSCHASGKVASKSKVGRFTHPTGVNISHADNRYVRLPLFSPAGAPLGKGDITCATCHNPHQWDPATNQAQVEDISRKGDNTNSFLRVANIESRLCRECHLIQKTIQGTSHDLSLSIYKNSLAPQLLKNSSGEGKTTQAVDSKKGGACQHCHAVHNAVSVKLWARQVGSGEDPITKICNSCHSDSMVAEHKQTGINSHPVNISIQKLGEDFRTDLPLFTDNLNRDEVGKIFCNTCHNTHQWDPAVPRPGSGEIVEGTSENSFLRKTANDPDDPLCDSCHKDVGLVRNTEHDLRISAPDEKNPQGKTTKQSGVCSSCHAAHNATHPYFLWTKDLGPGTDFISRACNSCHDEDRCASEKTTGQYSHPVDRSTFSVLEDLKSLPLPIFSSSLQRVGAETVSSLSPLHIDSLKAKQGMDLEESQDLKKWLDFLKRRYIATRRGKNKAKEKIEKLLKIKQQTKVKMETDKARIKELIVKVAEDNILYQKIYDKTSGTKRKIKLLKGQIKTLGHKIKQLESRMGSGPSSSRRGGPQPVEKKSAPPPETTPAPPGTDNEKKPTAAVTVKKKKKKSEAERRQEQLKRFEEDLTQKKTKLLILEKRNIKKLSKKYGALAKSLKKDKAELKILKKKYKAFLKQFKEMGVKQHKHKKHFENLQKKLAGLQEEIEEISPMSFINMADTREDILAQASLTDDLDMDFRRKFFDIRDEYASTIETYDQFREKYSGLRLKYKDILLYPDKKRKVSLMELEDLVIEGLAEDLERDIDPEPQGKIFCSTCHNVHRWDPNKEEPGPGKMTEGDFSNSFLRVSNDGGYRICVTCHKGKDMLEGTAHDLARSAPDERNVLDQTPAEAGLCGNCHLTHNAAGGLNLWAKKIDKRVVEKLYKFRDELKKTKKEIKNKRKEFKNTKTIYSQRLDKYTKRRKSDEKIEKRRQKIIKRIKETQTNIQNQPPVKQKASKKKIAAYKKQLEFITGVTGNAKKKSKLLKKAAGKIYVKLKKIKTTLEEAIKKNNKLSSDITELKEEFRRMPWDAMSLFCRTCHQDNGCAQSKKLTGVNHPLNVAVLFPETIPEVFAGPETKEKTEEDEKVETGEKDDDIWARKLYAYPLYTKEGTRGYEEGKVFCPTCHNVHQWDPIRHGKGEGELQEGDARNSFLRLENSPTPKLCSGCHPKQAPVARTDHDLILSAPDSQNPQGKTPVEAGTCGTCHITHNGEPNNKLWGGYIGPASLASWNKKFERKEDRSIKICTGCHNPDGAGASKVPQVALHPQKKRFLQLEVKTLLANPEHPYTDYIYGSIKRKLGILNIRGGAIPKIALFDEQGAPGAKGSITCMTCHDPHSWNIKGESPNKMAEGTLADSFLKKDTSDRFCTDCHGVGGIYNFAFFHQPRNRPEKPLPKSSKNPHWEKNMTEGPCTADGCHRKSVHGGLHPIGVDISAATERLKISKKLPLIDGKIECITCHNPKLSTAGFKFLRKKNRFFIRGIYEEQLKKKDLEIKAKEQFVGGPPKIAGLMAGPGSLGSKGGPESGGKAGKADAKKAKKSAKKKKARLLKLSWDSYQICYYCHIKEKYKRFSPHRNQLDAKGYVNKELCLVCHTQVPDREKIDKSNFYLVSPIQDMCRNCHNGYETEHPAKKDHFGKKVASGLAKRARSAMGALATFIPLNKQKMVCSSCHNPHATGVIQVPIAAKGAGDRSKLRLTGQTRCGLCHEQGQRGAPREGTGYSPF